MLGGGWVTNRYKAYSTGRETVPPEIFAWSQTGYTYDELQDILDAVAQQQDAQGLPRKRPFPEEVIVESSVLQDFWLEGAAEGLQARGYVYVSIEGDLFTCKEYQIYRRCNMQNLMGDVDPSTLTPASVYELQTYLEWVQPRLRILEQIHGLQETLPPVLKKVVRSLEELVGPDRYHVEAMPTPFIEEFCIEICNKQDPTDAVQLYGMDEARDFMENWIKYLQSKSDTEASAPAGQDQVEETTCATLQEENRAADEEESSPLYEADGYIPCCGVFRQESYTAPEEENCTTCEQDSCAADEEDSYTACEENCTTCEQESCAALEEDKIVPAEDSTQEDP
jgi:hypothetical protein